MILGEHLIGVLERHYACYFLWYLAYTVLGELKLKLKLRLKLKLYTVVFKVISRYRLTIRIDRQWSTVIAHKWSYIWIYVGSFNFFLKYISIARSAYFIYSRFFFWIQWLPLEVKLLNVYIKNKNLINFYFVNQTKITFFIYSSQWS